MNHLLVSTMCRCSESSETKNAVGVVSRKPFTTPTASNDYFLTDGLTSHLLP